MRVKTLRASGTRLITEVVLGQNDLGSNVVMRVDLNRLGDPAVQEALAPIEALALARAEEQVQQAMKNKAKERRSA